MIQELVDREEPGIALTAGVMSDFNPSPYRGDANIGHVSEELFKMYFVGSQVSTCRNAML